MTTGTQTSNSKVFFLNERTFFERTNSKFYFFWETIQSFIKHTQIVAGVVLSQDGVQSRKGIFWPLATAPGVHDDTGTLAAAK